MANRVSIVVRAQDRTRAGFRSVDRGLSRLQRRLSDASRSGGRFGSLLGGTARGLGALRGGLRVAARGTNALFNGFSSLTSVMGQHKLMAAAVVAGFMLLGPVATTLAAALTVGLGGAFVGLGALALKGDKQVKQAFSGMKDTVISTVKAAAEPMRGPLVDAMQLVSSEAVRMQPALRKAFVATGPLVRPLTEGLLDLGGNALPGFTKSLSRSKPIMAGFRSALGDIGTGLGDLFDTMTKGSNAKSLGDTWRRLGAGVNSLLDSVGELMNTFISSKTGVLLMAQAFFVLKGVLKGISLAFKSVESGLTGIDKMTGGLVSKLVGALTPATGRWKDKLGEASGAADRQSRSIKSLISAMQELADKARGAIDAESAFEQSIDDAAKAARENAGALRMSGGQLDLNSQKSRDAYNALSALAGATKENAEAAQKNGASWSRVNGIYDRGRQKLIATAMQMGLTRAKAKSLAAQILATPDKTVRVKGDISDAQRKLGQAAKQFRDLKAGPPRKLRANIDDVISKCKTALRKLRGVKGGAARKLRADISNVLRNAQRAQLRINQVHGRTVGIGISYYIKNPQTLAKAHGRRHGGIVGHAAEGGPRSRMTLVGEEGPELVDLPAGSRVRTAGATRRLAAAGRGGAPAVVEIRSAGSRLDDLLLEVLRRAIYVRGGDPNVVLRTTRRGGH